MGTRGPEREEGRREGEESCVNCEFCGTIKIGKLDGRGDFGRMGRRRRGGNLERGELGSRLIGELFTSENDPTEGREEG